jgi:hypothetical protein
MWGSKKPEAPVAPAPTTKARGDAAEDAALKHLQRQGLRLVQRNFKTPGRGGGEIDLIMREPDGTLVFIEVRQRASAPASARAARAPASPGSSNAASCLPRGTFCCGSGQSLHAASTWCSSTAPADTSTGCAQPSTRPEHLDTDPTAMIAPCFCNASSNSSSTVPT